MRALVRIEALMLVWAVLAGCSSPPDPGSAAESSDSATAPAIVIPVQVGSPIRGDIAAYLETTARVEAERCVEVTAEGMGQCKQMRADEGDSVKQGDVLAELDKKTAQAALQQVEVQVRQQEAEYERAKLAYESRGVGIIAKADYDAKKFAHEQGLANLKLKRIELDNLTIRAPISGLITQRHIQVGMLVSSGSPAFTIVDPSSYILIIHPPERELPRLQVGQVAKVTVDALQGEELSAVLRRINPAVDPASGTVKVTLEFDVETRRRLREAAFARVRLVMETHEDALLLPKDVLVEESGRSYVFVVEPGGEAGPAAEGATWIASRVEVETGLEDDRYVEILSGLADGARVVTVGQYNLKPESEVRVTTPEEALSSHLNLPADEALAKAEAEQEKAREEAKRRRSGIQNQSTQGR